MNGNERSSEVSSERISPARGPHKPKQANEVVTSLISTPSPGGLCCFSQDRSWRPKALPVTRRKRSSSSLVTVRSHSTPPRELSRAVYVIRPGGFPTSLAHIPCRKSQAPGPETPILARLDSSKRAAASRVARCSVTMAVDQFWPAQPRGRILSCSGLSLDWYQLTRSHPLFSPNMAPSA